MDFLMISDVRRINKGKLWDGVRVGQWGQGVQKRETVTEFQKREEKCLITKWSL
jgi:hypothetical protein